MRKIKIIAATNINRRSTDTAIHIVVASRRGKLRVIQSANGGRTGTLRSAVIIVIDSHGDITYHVILQL